MSRVIRILMVEDSPTDAKLISTELRKFAGTIEARRVDEEPAMLAALAEQTWDIVLSDWSMPRFSAHAALDVLKQSTLDIPFIIVTGTMGEQHAVAAMRAGAADYILKDQLDRLVPAIERELREHDTRRARVEAERRMQQMVASSVVGVWYLDPAGKTTFMNARLADMLGIAEDATANAHPEEFLDGGPSMPERMKLRRAGIAANYEQKIKRRDGGTMWVVIESAPIFDAKGEFEGVLAVVVDITERKQSEMLRREAELRFTRLAESGVLGVTVADMNGDIVDANDAYLKMIGYTREDVRARRLKWAELAPAEEQETRIRVAALLATQGVVPPFETQALHKDGTHIPVLCGAAMLDGPSVIAFAIDLSDRKRAEEAREKAERALRKSEEQLRHAQKMEAVGRLAGGVAHDFNNMLSVILSYGALIISDLEPDSPLKVDIEEIVKAGNRAADLTRQLLLFSRQQVMTPKVLDLNEVLAGMEKMLHRLVGEDVEIDTRVSLGLGRVRVDPSSIEQVIMNLVVNARDAMATGGTLTIEVSNVTLDETYAAAHFPANAGHHVMLCISDTGCGMEPATQARIFEPFFTTKDVGKGTGLGLSTVFGIVQQSGGHIWVESELGRGSSFKVYLPRIDRDADVRLSLPAPKTLRGTETILLVEDEDQVRTIIDSVLRRQGYRVLVARSGSEAIVLCEKHEGPIALILTDVVMPQMSGPEVAKRLTKLRPSIRVLFMSGYTDDSIVRHGVLDSDVAFLQKPIIPPTLLLKVREVLDAPS